MQIEETLIRLIKAKTSPRKVLTMILCQGSGIPMNRLSRELGLSTAAVTGLADSLESVQLIERVTTQRDRRSYTLKTTKKGTDFLADLMAGDAA